MAKGKKPKPPPKPEPPEAPLPLVANPPRPNKWLLGISAALLALWLLYLLGVAIWVAVHG